MGIPSVSPPPLASGDNNDYSGIGSAGFARITPNAAGSNLTGIVAPSADGTQIILLNLGSGNLTLVDESGKSAPENGFRCSRGADVVLETDDMVTLIYDLTTQRWRIY